LLPYWYFGVAFFAAIGFGAAVVWMSRRLPSQVSKLWASLVFGVAFAVAAGLMADSTEFPPWAWGVVTAVGIGVVAASLLAPAMVNTRNFLTTTAVAIVVLGATAGVTFIDGWARWNYAGYEAKESWPEYESLMVELDRLPDGRVMWENNSGLNQYGTPMSPMLIPYWTEGSQKSMEGLYFESSLTTPFHFINHSEMSFKSSNPIPGLKYHVFDMERGLKHMDVYGVDYYVSFTPEAAEKALGIDEFELVTTTEPFQVFRLPETQLVEAATHLPAVYEVPDRSLLKSLTGSGSVMGRDGEPLPSFHEMALEWYEDVDEMDRWVVADGPAEWPRIESIQERPDTEIDVPENPVSNIVLEDHRISFTTEAVGVPHVVKISYFPNWKATGADGPWRAAPSLMVVVPTDNEVVIEFQDTWAESSGQILTIVGLVGLLVGGFVAWRRTTSQIQSSESVGS
ncbi:MAG: 6-pyruvoyl-tetrahydropterin synthase-related protein, partial [Acidimicrobiia bacterium]